jgi:hypothetical protein
MSASEVRLADPPMVVHWDGRLRVTDPDGRPLDTAAAEVLMALGGKEPAWLVPLEALLTVESAFAGDWGQVRLAATAMGAPGPTRAQLARTASEPAVLLGLAALGEPQVLRNPAVTGREWDVLIAHRRRGVAARARNIADVLPPGLAEHPDPEARMRVARNPACPASLLSRLADDPADQVRKAVGTNPSTEARALRRMLSEKRNQLQVWEAIAANPKISWRGLEKCLREGPDQAREAAVANPRLPKWRVATLVTSKWSATRRALAGRPDASAKRLAWTERFSRRDQPGRQNLIRARIYSHPNASEVTKARVQQLNAFMKSAETPLPMWRKLAPPAPTEVLVLALGLGMLAVALATGPNIGGIFFALLLMGAVVVRCRTVRPGTKVSKARAQKQVPTDRRLIPTTRRNLYNRFLVLALVISAYLAGEQYDNGFAGSGGQGSPSGPTVVTFGTLPTGGPDLVGSLPFYIVVSDSKHIATRADIARFDEDALRLEVAMAHTRLGDDGTLDQAYTKLLLTLIGCTVDVSTSAWNENLPKLRAALGDLERASRS